jgi:hypothetical protein
MLFKLNYAKSREKEREEKGKNHVYTISIILDIYNYFP